MATINGQRNRMIRKAVMQWPDATEGVIRLWERLGAELISIIGENGFQSIYTRSIHLTGTIYPWIVVDDPPQPTESRFDGLKICLAGRDIADAREASISMLITFLDILSMLVGDVLMIGILRSAWGDDVLDTLKGSLNNE